MTSGWWHTWFQPSHPAHASVPSVNSCSRGCLTIWCPQPSSCSRPCPCCQTAKSTVDTSPLPIGRGLSWRSPLCLPARLSNWRSTSIWAEVLGLEHIGIHDPFLELGGESLLAARVTTRVLDTFHVELSQSVLMEAATVAHMAETIVEHQAAQVDHDEMRRIVAEIKGQWAFEERDHR